jgi:hypothetical protein
MPEMDCYGCFDREKEAQRDNEWKREICVEREQDRDFQRRKCCGQWVWCCGCWCWFPCCECYCCRCCFR